MHGDLKPNFIDNPFTKRRNQEWDITEPSSLAAPISPPLKARRIINPRPGKHNPWTTGKHEITRVESPPNLAAIEAGEIKICDHLAYFSFHLSRSIRFPISSPRLSVPEFQDLYRRNQHSGGRHFVIHQHDHPVAGVHYDLRLQINETSSASWAIMYGLPGNVGSRRLNRNATETRVHNLWNHLIESASLSTGSLLIWDTGEFSVLPYRKPRDETDDELSSDSDSDLNDGRPPLSEPQKLSAAFQTGKIRLRLHGTKLPPNYTITLRLSTDNQRATQRRRPVRKRGRKAPGACKIPTVETPPPSDDEDISVSGTEDTVPDAHTPPDSKVSALEREIAEQEDDEVRRTNAYPGASNTINSIHQRTWYLSMDRSSSGFLLKRDEKGGRVWQRRREDGKLLGFEPFFVMGQEVERSVITGRRADEIMKDEGVEGYIGRKGWRAVLE